MSPQLLDDLLLPQERDNPVDSAHYSFDRRRQRWLALSVILILCSAGGLFGLLAMARGDQREGSILLLAAAVNAVLLLGKGYFKLPLLALQVAAGSVIALYFYLLVWGGWAGTGALWGLALAPAVLMLLGHRLGLLVFIVLFAATWLVFELGDGEAWTAHLLPAELSVYESRYLCVLALLGFYGFLLEFDRHRAIRALLKTQTELSRLATRDELTGIPNRRAMQQTLRWAERRSQEKRCGYGLVLGDIDLFKQINDTHGHDCGDQVIAAVATALSQGLRDGDMVARWGGEEFLVLLPDTDRDGALAVAAKLREAAAGVRVRYGAVELAPTLSFGVVAAEDCEPVDQSIRRADRALYRAKRGGRNCMIEG